MFSDRSIKIKLLTIVLSIVLIIVIALEIISIVSMKNEANVIIANVKKSVFKSKEQEVKNYISLVYKTLEDTYSQTTKENEEKLKKETLIAISKMRYGDGNYFWINDSNNKMLMHPNSSLIGKNVSDIKDKKGKYLFKEATNIASSKKDGGVLNYFWTIPGKDGVFEKISYVKKFEPWDMIIGTGVYLEDLENEIISMQKNAEEELYHSVMLSIIIVVIIFIVTLFVILLTVNKVVASPLKDLENGLLNFFKYLNKEASEVKELPINSKDEIGNMSLVINENIDKTKKMIDEDETLIQNVKEVVEEVKNGVLYKKLEKNTSNESLQELKTIFNEMLEILSIQICDDIKKIQLALGKFQSLDFTHRIDDSIGETSKGLNNLADIINNMLVENKSNGLTLESSSNKLFTNVESLSSASNQAAASLEETSAALEEITSNISSNTSNVIQMANHAKEVTNSANTGQSLATKTTSAMDEINEEVTAISEAISVIDQIAFQTNILSLNAAVEAATAGESGKGFAVVAQEVRNLAARSAEAAKEIKDLVENATSKANTGKDIADEMIQGYEQLNVSITKTIEIISDVETASREQQQGIEQINNAITQLDQQTQENASVANNTKEVATNTQIIAQTIVKNANEKEFIGKSEVKGKESF